MVSRLTEKATARMAVVAVAQQGQLEPQPNFSFVASMFIGASPSSRVRLERTDTKETRNWALPDRPVFERVGVYTGDGRVATLRTGNARMVE